MEPVNRYKFVLPDSTGNTLNVPIEMNFQIVDQAEIIERQFVQVETEEAINPIIDYEKVRFSPTFTGGTFQALDNVTYNLHFWDDTNNAYYNAPAPTNYAQLGFTDDDLRFRKNRFKNSFIRLDFYDSDILTDQRLISFIIIQPDIRLSDIQSNSQLYPVANKSVSFGLGNPLGNNEVFGEGFYLYHFKDEVDSNAPKALYMRASFSNAKNGKTTNMMTAPYNIANPIEIDELVNQIHTRYLLIRDDTGYYYGIDPAYSPNVVTIPTSYTINLYEVRVA